MRKFNSILPLCVVLALSSCEHHQPKESAKVEPSAKESVAVPMVNDAVRYLDKHDNVGGSKREVAQAALTLPVGGEMMLSGDLYFSVDNEYQSASGKLCKELTVSNAGALVFESICYDNIAFTMEYLENIFALDAKSPYTGAGRRLINQDETVVSDEKI